jgi:hypothetical protein
VVTGTPPRTRECLTTAWGRTAHSACFWAVRRLISCGPLLQPGVSLPGGSGFPNAQSAFAIKTRTRDLDESDFLPLLRRFLRDVARRQFQVLRVTNAHYETAVDLIEKYVQRPLRTLDARHLSVALDLRRRSMLDQFVCADESLCSVAIDAGLVTLNPTKP